MDFAPDNHGNSCQACSKNTPSLIRGKREGPRLSPEMPAIDALLPPLAGRDWGYIESKRLVESRFCHAVPMRAPFMTGWNFAVQCLCSWLKPLYLCSVRKPTSIKLIFDEIIIRSAFGSSIGELIFVSVSPEKD